MSISTVESVTPFSMNTSAVAAAATPVSFWNMVTQINHHILTCYSLEGSSVVTTTHTVHRTPTPQHQTQQQQRSINNNIHQYYYYYSMVGAIIGIIICSTLRILDTGYQIQRHPIPILLGYTYGNAIGGLIVWLLFTFSK
jgi:hypothetical protein